MANKIITATIKHRQATAATWESKNPVLAAGEFGYDTTNKITKIGDGSTPWKKLPFFATTNLSFAKATWGEISAIANSGNARDYFDVGEEKTITLTTGEEVTLVILGFNQDIVTIAKAVYNNVKAANSVYPTNAAEVQLRRNYLITANCELQCLISQLDIAREFVRNTDSNKPINGKVWQTWIDLITTEAKLLAALKNKDKERYKTLLE